MPKYIPAKSVHGEGGSEDTNIYGVWECSGVGMGQQFQLRLVIEDRQGSPFTGELKLQSLFGLGMSIHKLRGEWARVLDVDAKLLLGMYLKYVQDGTTSGEWLIPFQQKIGDALVGTDAQGVQYTSRLVESHVGGF